MTTMRTATTGRPAWPGEGLAVDQTRAGLGLRYSRDEAVRPAAGFWARVVGSAGSAHGWEQVLFDVTGEAITAVNGLSSASTGIDAWEINGRDAVPSGTLVWVYSLASTCDEEGRQNRVYLFDLGCGTRVDETGEELDPAVAGDGENASELADEEEWSIESQAETRGVVVPVLSRVVYNPEGDQVLYGFFRSLEFDANGHLTAVSAETRRVIETPEECS